jgi:hypothetical protein
MQNIEVIDFFKLLIVENMGLLYQRLLPETILSAPYRRK